MSIGMLRESTTPWTVFLGCLLINSVGTALAAPPDTIDLAINDPRPVARAIDELQKYSPYPVSYEDPQYSYSEELRDVSTELGIARSNGRGIVPAGGSLEVRQLPLSAGKDQTRISALERKLVAEQGLRRILEVQATRTNGGKFAVEQSDQMLHVVPTLIRNQEGEWIENKSPLSHQITIAPAERDAAEMLNEICTALSKQTGMTIGLASGPRRTLYGNKSVQGANNEAARDVLIRTLDQAGGHMTWKLFYAPDLRWYALNIVALPRPAATQSKPERPQPSPGGKPPGVK